MTSPKHRISPEETALFREVVKTIPPLPKDKHPSSPKHRSPPISTPSHSTHPCHPPLATSLYPEDAEILGAEDSLHFARSGLQQRVLRQLQRGQIHPEAHLDLHQQTTTNAVQCLTQFIETCITQRKRWVVIIHGKGHFSKTGKPVLKNFLNQWLRTRPEILAFHSAKPKHGGTGALYVLLKIHYTKHQEGSSHAY
ncbi:MAG: hypothetical protein A3F41_06865 [Coxiella sp. RIFCSPHIGHO2_12_FULL_44_14]|nr:MAG: hypothetical protein A3F41_06865 [Coxiella sp. RIFCSPHIGHO2_12_FULL_44_14]